MLTNKSVSQDLLLKWTALLFHSWGINWWLISEQAFTALTGCLPQTSSLEPLGHICLLFSWSDDRFTHSSRNGEVWAHRTIKTKSILVLYVTMHQVMNECLSTYTSHFLLLSIRPQEFVHYFSQIWVNIPQNRSLCYVQFLFITVTRFINFLHIIEHLF